MNHYLLLDGALVLSTLERVSGFAKAAPWYATVLPGDARLAGPVLLSQEELVAAGHDAQDTFQFWRRAYPCSLHASLIESPLGLADLARHFERHLRILTDDGQSLALRFADCRVLAVLPKVLTPEQWQQFSAPMATWNAHGRDGKPLALPVPTEPRTPEETAPLKLTCEQIDQLVALAEPDALLAHIGRAPQQRSGLDHAWAYKVAAYCIRRWQDHGHTDRDVLHRLTLRALDTDAKVFDQPEALGQILGAARR